MSATNAFQGPASRTDWLMLMQVSAAIAAGDLASAAEYMAAYSPNVPAPLWNGGIAAGVLSVQWDASHLWIIPGSYGSDVQWTAQFLGGPLGEFANIPGSILEALAGFATALYQTILPLTQAGPKIVLFGHGVGGAFAEIVGAMLKQKGQLVQGIYTAGAPGVGDTNFASAISSITYRLEDTTDPVVAIPPAVAQQINGLPPGFSSLANMPATVQAGNATTLDTYGNLTGGSSAITAVAALQQLVTLAAGSQSPTEYIRRLLAQTNPSDSQVAGANGYAQPWILYGQNPPSQGGGQSPAGAAAQAAAQAQTAAQACQRGCSQQSGLSGTISVG